MSISSSHLQQVWQDIRSGYDHAAYIRNRLDESPQGLDVTLTDLYVRIAKIGASIRKNANNDSFLQSNYESLNFQARVLTDLVKFSTSQIPAQQPLDLHAMQPEDSVPLSFQKWVDIGREVDRIAAFPKKNHIALLHALLESNITSVERHELSRLITRKGVYGQDTLDVVRRFVNAKIQEAQAQTIRMQYFKKMRSSEEVPLQYEHGIPQFYPEDSEIRRHQLLKQSEKEPTPSCSKALMRDLPPQEALDAFEQHLPHKAFCASGLAKGNFPSNDLHPLSEGMKEIYVQLGGDEHTGCVLFWDIHPDIASPNYEKIKAVESIYIERTRSELQKIANKFRSKEGILSVHDYTTRFFGICEEKRILRPIPNQVYKTSWKLAGSPSLNTFHSEMERGKRIFYRQQSLEDREYCALAIESALTVCQVPSEEQYQRLAKEGMSIEVMFGKASGSLQNYGFDKRKAEESLQNLRDTSEDADLCLEKARKAYKPSWWYTWEFFSHDQRRYIAESALILFTTKQMQHIAAEFKNNHTKRAHVLSEHLFSAAQQVPLLQGLEKSVLSTLRLASESQNFWSPENETNANGYRAYAVEEVAESRMPKPIPVKEYPSSNASSDIEPEDESSVSEAGGQPRTLCVEEEGSWAEAIFANWGIQSLHTALFWGKDEATKAKKVFDTAALFRPYSLLPFKKTLAWLPPEKMLACKAGIDGELPLVLQEIDNEEWQLLKEEDGRLIRTSNKESFKKCIQGAIPDLINGMLKVNIRPVIRGTVSGLVGTVMGKYSSNRETEATSMDRRERLREKIKLIKKKIQAEYNVETKHQLKIAKTAFEQTVKDRADKKEKNSNN